MTRSLRDRVLHALGLPSRTDMAALRQTLETRTSDEAREIARRLDRLEHKSERLRHRTEHLDRSIGNLSSSLRKGQLRKIDQNVDALLRHAFLPADLLTTAPQRLLTRRFRGLSQNEEDGITIGLLARAGAVTSRFVEVGAGTNGGNSGYLARECGWRGLMLEVDAARVQVLRDQFGPAVTVVQAKVTRENINDLVTQHGFAGDIDLLSIDIDGNDYWVWERLTACRPRVVVIEFNWSFGTARPVTIPYDAAFQYGGVGVLGGHYHGASLPALAQLGARKGYRLVMTEPRGVNAFFVRDDLAGDLPPLDPSSPPPAVDGDRAPDPAAFLEELAHVGLSLVEVS